MKEFIAKFHHPTGTKDGTAEYRTHVFKAFDAERAKAYCRVNFHPSIKLVSLTEKVSNLEII